MDDLWQVGQRVRMQADDSLVPQGTDGTVMRVYTDLASLIVRFDGARDVCLVGTEEVETVEGLEREVG
jgi:hypothetical protein